MCKTCTFLSYDYCLLVGSLASAYLVVSEVGFEPTPSCEDQNTISYVACMTRVLHLESGALDRSAILTTLLRLRTIALNMITELSTTTKQGIEPWRAEHIGLAVQHLNLSVTSSVVESIRPHPNCRIPISLIEPKQQLSSR